MVTLRSLVFGLLTSAALASPLDLRSQHVHHCGTRSISSEERELLKRQQPLPDNGELITLGCVVHFCCGGSGDCPPSAKIEFKLEKITHINDARCTTRLEDNQAMDSLKARVHQGNTSTLNLVYLPTNEGPGVKGMCVLPEPNVDIASNIGSTDGCVIAMDTLPGASNTRRDAGDIMGIKVTTTHEMGHWLSLPHETRGGQSPSQDSSERFSGGSLRGRSGGAVRNIMEPSLTRARKRYAA
ncbi:hypothetical protein LLEC1_01023 [Akanthomyces lecanii]|uniref:Peptidase M43 pregnancy-associated plasma-A domain-containing protein n=1 Tax=Cordyceps confragosa TaxID=2714763 RepID=A0A179ICA2_CORDF|nr:hypothetical protein LLEC1_01023 [Akanthomyces lecanii]